MCGIIGVVVRDDARFSNKLLTTTIEELYYLSESRGKEASGIAVHTRQGIGVHKEARSASYMIESKAYQGFLEEFFGDLGSGRGAGRPCPALIGHTRLTTSGVQGIPTNNQPVARNGLVAVHNGIIVNFEDLWAKHSDLTRETDVDTEVVVCLLRKFFDQTKSMSEAIRLTMEEIYGTASVALLFEELDDLVLATNTGSLYTCTTADRSVFLFASERSILEGVVSQPKIARALGPHEIRQVKAGKGVVVSLLDLSTTSISWKTDTESPALTRRSSALAIRDTREEELAVLAGLRRCTRCVLPETFPFIEYDSEGVCSYCLNYTKAKYLGAEALEERVAPYRRTDGEPDCLIAFSGGRDSSYSLHYAVRELGLNPIVYTYDWGMVNDLARRNQARLCGKLGIEQILVSADIKRKRENIGMNVRAWLRKPDLGTIPLFMAGDKQFFYYCNQLKKRTGLDLTIWASNQLERTDFKVGFCGISSANDKKRIYKMSLLNKTRMGLYYAGRFLRNPAYVNRSLSDTLFAFFSYYFIEHDHLYFFDYVPWSEKEINDVLISEYDWEISPDTPTTWRIGDETAAFYNYIYTTIAGFCENDTFRSNQVREGLITREEAMKFVEAENESRWDSIKRYLALINVDFDQAMSVINSLPKLYMPN
jgi:glucosamine--fructose-6-phosphate aminotransferase (isomerizing)